MLLAVQRPHLCSGSLPIVSASLHRYCHKWCFFFRSVDFEVIVRADESMRALVQHCRQLQEATFAIFLTHTNSVLKAQARSFKEGMSGIIKQSSCYKFFSFSQKC